MASTLEFVSEASKGAILDAVDLFRGGQSFAFDTVDVHGIALKKRVGSTVYDFCMV